MWIAGTIVFASLWCFFFFSFLFVRDDAKAWASNAKLLGEKLAQERLREHNWERRAQSAESKLAKIKKITDPAPPA